MIRLNEIRKAHTNLHPGYTDPLSMGDLFDERLAIIKKIALKEYLDSLEDQLVVYQERFATFGTLSKVSTCDWGFEAKLIPLNPIFLPQYLSHRCRKQGWEFSVSWESIRLRSNRLCCSIAGGWTLWTDSEEVDHIEKIFLSRGPLEAHRILKA